MRKTLHILLLLLLAGSTIAQAQDNSTRGVLLDRIVAVVNDDVLMQSELEAEAQQLRIMIRDRGQAVPPDNVFLPQVLERMIAIQLQLQFAERAGIQVSDDRVNMALTDIAQRQGSTLSELPALLAQEGINYADFRENIREEMLLSEVRRRGVDDRVTVSPQEVEEYLERQKGMSSDEEFLVSHILIAVPGQAPPEDIEAARQRIADIRAQIVGGASFAEMSAIHSDGQQALEGGSLGWRKLQDVPTLFTDAVANLDKGGVSEPIRSGSGWHLVRVDDVRGRERVVATETHSRHILLKPNTLRPEAATFALARKLLERLRKGEDFAALAKEYSEDPGSAVQGGDLGWQPPGTFATRFQETIDAMQPNEISEPFETQFGVHIAQVIDRRETDFTENVEQNRAFQAIKRRKAEEQFPIWLQQQHDDAQIDIRLDSGDLNSRFGGS